MNIINTEILRYYDYVWGIIELWYAYMRIYLLFDTGYEYLTDFLDWVLYEGTVV